MRGLCNFGLAADDATTLDGIFPYACQTKGGTRQTYCLSRYLLSADVPGDFVECGCAAGAQLACMGLAMRREGKQRPIHGFDSFDGIPHAGPNDSAQPGILGNRFLMDPAAPLSERLKSTGISGCSIQQVRQIMDSFGFPQVKLHKGWFQDTLPVNELGAIAFLRLDGDLYESTQCCLQWLYDKVSVGGIVYVDDYALQGCGQAIHEFLIDRGIEPELLADTDGNKGAVYWIK